MKLYDLAYDDGSHYFESSRREAGDLMASKDEDELTRALPDAVSACLVVMVPNDEPRMVLNYEFRYPTGQYVLGIPSGLIDARDADTGDPLIASMTREIAEETGVRLGADDRIWVINQLLFNTPGMTDESTALLCAVARLDDLSALTHAGAEGSERFGAFELLTKDEVKDILKTGRDPHGHFYPMVAWAAMAYFACDLWKEGLSE
ncbi:MAG: NUDIX hydrolase [Atopobiaceae bacterium]|nr:NUDIX hydrolase [Atopobiaceae bacterium]MBR1830376.1 NUDIX hydrolase [Atopobiaceae bacterium]